MKIFYVTLNQIEEARNIGRQLLEQKLAVCVNWFPITCAYLWEGKITEEPEVVLIVKTQQNYRHLIEQVIKENITYTNFIAEISLNSLNQDFINWLNSEIPQRSRKAEQS